MVSIQQYATKIKLYVQNLTSFLSNISEVSARSMYAYGAKRHPPCKNRILRFLWSKKGTLTILFIKEVIFVISYMYLNPIFLLLLLQQSGEYSPRGNCLQWWWQYVLCNCETFELHGLPNKIRFCTFLGKKYGSTRKSVIMEDAFFVIIILIFFFWICIIPCLMEVCIMHFWYFHKGKGSKGEG